MNNKSIKISVRNLVEFIYRSGDLDNKFNSIARAQEGTKIHQMVQKSLKDEYKNEPDIELLTETQLKHYFTYKDLDFMLEGRADNILLEKNKTTVIEIKSTTRELSIMQSDYNFLHWAQAKFYGYIYAFQNSIESISIELLYCHVESHETKSFVENYTFIELERYFYEVLDLYFHWANFTSKWIKIRDKSIESLAFPFITYRLGQRELAVNVYRTIKEGSKLYAQAPTGIGKTMSTSYPTIKALGEGYGDRIFYLTSKTITRTVAEESLSILRRDGLRIKSTTITAKEKICFKEQCQCNPEYCEYAKGHFDRVNDAIFNILKEKDNYTRSVIEDYSKKYTLCPFEFSLDLTLWSDFIICDYNYLFDPRVYLKRFFMENNESYLFLIDEAHNLVDRAREMFSAVISKIPILNLKKKTRDTEPKIYKALNKLNSYMITLRKQCDNNAVLVLNEEPKEAYGLLKKLIEECDIYLGKNQPLEYHDELLEVYFSALTFIKISEFYNSDFTTYIEKLGDDVKLKLFCLNPSKMIKTSLKKGRASIFFSATLSPIQFFKEVLGGDTEDYSLKLSSPFSKENRKIIVGDNINTKYRYREYSYDIIVSYINKATEKYKGNYIIFFPSYVYMRAVYDRYTVNYSSENIIIQNGNMTEEEREEFLHRFSDGESDIIAFCVLGGIFSEGIDLVGNKLVGTIIVGVGLPQLCFERQLIEKYFDDTNNLGFHYAYTFPGINRVIQAAGRVIRTEQDKGIIILLDDRFTNQTYKKILPEEWHPYDKVKDLADLEISIDDFMRKSMD
ncbi:helicase C-terminal domain-containing protein [Clostridium sp.]|uniref:helicase C-terminal domain-containing protein n=1 Tax=Clostridium sp. TaxID=1506 RepID=UPI002FC8A4B5